MMDEQRLTEIEALVVAETSGSSRFVLMDSGPPWFAPTDGGNRLACAVIDLIAEVRRLRSELSYLKACQL